MKKLILFLALFVAGIVSAQEEFSFQLYFEDAAGNRDTITLGYDPLATEKIDTAFGEENLINQPWSDSTFEVRITDKMFHILYDYSYGQAGLETFRTKKQIVDDYCLTTSVNGSIYGSGRQIFVDVKNAVFPLIISFDPQLSQNQCVNGSIVNTQDPFIHWDTPDGPVYFFDWLFRWGPSGRYESWERNTSEYSELIYKDVDNKYIFTYLITLQDNRWITLNSNDLPKENFKIYLNPFLESFEIQSDFPVSSIQLTDVQGKQIPFEQNGNTIRPLDCSLGIYFLSFEQNAKMYNFKIIKS